MYRFRAAPSLAFIWMVFLVVAAGLSTPVSAQQSDPQSFPSRTDDVAAQSDEESASDEKSAAQIRFTFREQPWIDVLDWFAKQSDMSLVVQQLPPGNFTYSDTQTYSPEEALDLLNGVLSTRGFTLIHRDRMLVCVDLENGLPDNLIPRVAIDNLKKHGQYELIEVMFPLGKRNSSEVVQEVEPLLGPHGTAEPLPKTNQLLVTTTAGRMRGIHDLIQSIPEPKPKKPQPKKPKPPSPVLKSYSARDVDPEAAVEMLNTMVGDVKLTIDKRTQQINAYARPKQQEVIQQLLDQLRSAEAEQLKPKLAVYELEHDAPASLIEQLNVVVPEATLRLDSAANRLIAFATDQQHQQLTEAMDKLEAAGGGMNMEVPVVYQLQRTDAESMRQMVEQLYPRAKVTLEPKSDRMVVMAEPDEHLSLKQLLEQFSADRENPPQINAYELDRLPVDRVRTVLQSLIPNVTLSFNDQADQLTVIGDDQQQQQVAELLKQLKTARRPEDPKQIKSYSLTVSQRRQFDENYRKLDPRLADIELLESQTPGQLIVLADAEQHQRVEQVLETIRKHFTEASRELRYYQVSATLREKFNNLRDSIAPQLRSIQVLRDESDPRLAVLATEAEHRQVRLLLDQLGEDLPSTDRQLKIIRVTPTQRERFLNVRAQLSEDDDLSGIQVLDESRPEELVVWGTPDQLTRLDQLLTSLKSKEPSVTRQLVTYPIREGDPEAAETVLKQLFPDTRIIVDADSRRVMVWTTAEQQAAVEQAVEQLDAPAAAGKKRMAYYPLGDLDARDVRQLFQQLVPEMSMVTDRDTNSIVAWGSDRDHEQLAKAVKDFQQQQAASARHVVSYPLGARDAGRMRRMLDNLAPAARFVADDENQALIVWGTDEEHASIKQALQAIETSDDSSDASFEVYPVSRVDASDLIRLIYDMVPNVRVRSSRDDRQLYVWTTAKYHQMVAQAIQRIESGEPAQRIQVYPLGDAQPDEIRQLLDPQRLQSATVIPDPKRNALIVRASATQHAELKKAIAALLEQLPEARRRRPSVYRFQHIQAESAREALASLVPSASLTVDPAQGTLIAVADPDDHELIDSTVQQMDQPNADGRETNVYRLQTLDVDSAQDALQALVPSATIVEDDDSRALLVTADPEQQARIGRVIQQMDQVADGRITRVYTVDGDANMVRYSLRALLRDATVYADRESNALLVTASEADQQRAAEVVQQMQSVAGDRSTVVYRVPEGDLGAAEDALRALAEEATVVADEQNRSLLVTASPRDQQRIGQVVSQLTGQTMTDRETRVFQLKYSDADAAREAIKALMPRIQLSADLGNRTLLATGAPEQLARVETIVTQMDQPGDQQAQLHAYPVMKADTQAVFNALQQLYSGNDRVQLTMDEVNNSVLVRAPLDEHTMVARVVSQMENSATSGTNRKLVVYQAQQADVDAVRQMLDELVRTARPSIDLSVNPESRQIVAVATPQQHELLADAVQQLKPEPAQLEVFPLQMADPFAVELAIDQLYAEETSRPVASGDTATQQLYVRGTAEQLQEVRGLLTKMGELPPKDIAGRQGMRIVPIGGDIDAALQQLQDVWPRLRKNEIRVIRTQGDKTQFFPAEPKRSSNGNGGATLRNLRPPSSEQRSQPDASEGRLPDQSSQPRSNTDKVGPQSSRFKPTTWYVADQQDPSGGDAEEGPSDEDQLVEVPDLPEPETRPDDGDDAEQPVVVVAGPGSISLYSDDEQALDQAESLLRMIARQNRSDAGSGNFAVFSLRNAGAQNVAKLLTDLFEQMPVTTRAALGRVSMVADDRLNAIVVHGRPADRKVIAQLLRVLDSENVPDTLANARPKIVPVHYLEASQLLSKLQGVYATQLKSGARRPEMDIPEGIEPEVANVLRQLNAASAGPLLTLEVDEVTNSIIVLAPTELSAQVTDLIRQLDENARINESRAVHIVRLRQTNVSNLEETLGDLIKSTNN